MAADIRITDAGELFLSGVLDFRSGLQLSLTGQQLIAAHVGAHVVLDCSAVERSTSVGLSLILVFMRAALAHKKTFAVCNLTQDMQQIAQVTGLLDCLSLRALAL